MQGIPGVDRLIQDLQNTFLFEVDNDDLYQFAEDGCLFYIFIWVGLQKQKREYSRKHGRDSVMKRPHNEELKPKR